MTKEEHYVSLISTEIVIIQAIQKTESPDEITVEVNGSITPEDITENGFNLRFKTHCFCNPTGHIDIKLELISRYKTLHKVDPEYIKENQEKLAHNLGVKASYLVSILSEQIIGVPFILNPQSFIITNEDIIDSEDEEEGGE